MATNGRFGRFSIMISSLKSVINYRRRGWPACMLALFLLSFITQGCISDAISTSSTDLLTFSRDTVSFDTVFTDLGTPTARLVVSNPAKKGVIVSSIRFRNPDSRFRVNVDGMAGTEFRDVEIRGRDSIYVFIECYIPETEGNEPQYTEDALEFVTNGVTQSVTLEAWGQNVTRLHGLTVDSSTRFTAERPYVVFDSLIVAPGAVLTLEPDVKLLFHDKAYMRIYGTLEALGSVGHLIDMRGDRLDDVLPDVEYDVMAGQWQGLSFAPGSFNNRMEYVDMRSTSGGLSLDSCSNLSDIKLTLLNSWLHNSQSHVLSAPYCKVEATGCCFSESAGSVVDLHGGDFRFLQCTFANNYLFASTGDAIIGLWNVQADETGVNRNPAMRASFENCIVYGMQSDINIGDLTGTEVFFRYVSLQSEGTDDENFINCIWNTDPMFMTDRPKYIFNYRLMPDSPVASAGNPAYITGAAITDMFGVNRLGYGNPSLGAFQYVPSAGD